MGEFFYNNMKHSSTQQTPFMVDTRRNPCMGFEPQQPHSTLDSANEFAEHIALGIEEAKVALTKAKDKYTMYYNRRRNVVVTDLLDQQDKLVEKAFYSL
jgi:hypothetical protein